MLNLDPEKLLVIGVLALVVLGPTRLPDVARSVGRVVGQLRRMSGSFQTELQEALAEPRQALQHAVDEFGIQEVRSSMASVADSFRPAPTPVPTPEPSPLTPPPAASPPASTGAPLPVPDDPSFN